MSGIRGLRRRVRVGVVLGLPLAFAGWGGMAHGQTNTALQWNFNDSTTNTSINNTSGTPTVTLLGGITADFATGSPLDPATPTNMGWNTTTYPAAGTLSGTAGVQFTTPTTSASGGFNNVIIRFDQRNSGTASRFLLLEYTLDGTNWINAGGPNAGVYATTLNDTFFSRTLDLSQIAAASNNANLAFRTRTVFDPATGTDYAATTSTGTYGTGGTIRFDMVTVSRGVRWVGGTGTDVTTAANWGGTLPTADDTVLFGASANTTVNVPVAVSIGQIAFRSDAPAYTITGTEMVTSTVGIVNNSTATQTINTPVTLSGARTIENNGTLIFNGNLTAAGTTNLHLLGSGQTAINGTYTGNDINLTAGHTLGGIGTLTNEVQTHGGRVRGGFSDGTNNFGTLTINIPGGDLELYAAPGNRGSTFVVEASRTGVNTVQNSRIALVGGASTDFEMNDAGVGTNKLRFEVLASNLVLGETYVMTILTTDSTGSIEFNNVGQADGNVIPAASYDIVSPNFVFGSSEIKVVDVTGAGSTLVVTFTPVPEPSTVLGLAAIALGGVTAFRRRLRHATAATGICEDQATRNMPE